MIFKVVAPYLLENYGFESIYHDLQKGTGVNDTQAKFLSGLVTTTDTNSLSFWIRKKMLHGARSEKYGRRGKTLSFYDFKIASLAHMYEIGALSLNRRKCLNLDSDEWLE